ncbi:MAG: DinB family protein [Flavobacteriaceae bacterium]|nr:DinB family protein [Flavobacteriaceae bacterium]
MNYNIDQALEILEQTPNTLKQFLSNLSEEWIFCNEGEETWSAFDVVGHLIHCENTDWIPRLNIILSAKDDKTFEPFDRFAQFEDSKGKSMLDLLNEFEYLRIKNLDYLRSLNLTEKELSLIGNHPSLGEVTVKQLLATWATHDLGHIAQISRVMAKQYKDEVGPWVEYLSILNK